MDQIKLSKDCYNIVKLIHVKMTVQGEFHMKFPGKIYPKKINEKYHYVEIPLLGIHTQGKNYKDSMRMAKEALEELLCIEIEIEKYGNEGEFIITAQELKPLISRFLEAGREKSV